MQWEIGFDVVLQSWYCCLPNRLLITGFPSRYRVEEYIRKVEEERKRMKL